MISCLFKYKSIAKPAHYSLLYYTLYNESISLVIGRRLNLFDELH